MRAAPAGERLIATDLSEAFGVLEFTDVIIFLTDFGTGCP